MPPAMSGHTNGEEPCRACSDFKSWTKSRMFSFKPKEPDVSKANEVTEGMTRRKDCPLDKDDLGLQTWGFLHTMAAYYPVTPTAEQRQSMMTFFSTFAHFYPCKPCAEDFQIDLQDHPPQTESRNSLSKWLCDRHNVVNRKLGKPEFDCSKIHERWKSGWADGSCD